MPYNHLVMRMLRFVMCGSAFWLSAYAASATDSQNPRVLLIHSYHQGFEWTDSITEGVMNGFRESDDSVRLFVEYMDSKHYKPADVSEPFRALCAFKYGDIPPDVILCSDNNALDFIVKHRSILFPDSPIVFCGINDFSAEMLGGGSNITGVIEEPSYRETAELALEIHPNTKRIYVLACSAETSRIHIERFMQSVRGMDESVEIVPLHDLTEQEFADALGEVEISDIVINLGLHRTSDNTTLSTHEAYSFIREHTAAPIYNLWSIYLRDHGEFLAGGVMIDGEAQGRQIAEIALKILDGTPVSRLPIITDSPNIPIINFQELERLGIDQRPVRETVTVINRPFLFYETYRLLVWSVAIVISGMAAQILFLGLSVRKRRRVETELRIQGIALREREEKLRVTLDSIAEAVITTDINGHVLQLNPVAEELTGWPAAEALRRPIGEIFKIIDVVTRGPLKNPVKEVVAKGRSDLRANHTLLISRKNTECRVSGSGAPIRDAQGGIIGVVLVFRDVTEDLKLQEKLQQGQKMDAIGQLAGGVAHDFNNMLGGIIASAEMAQIELKQQKDPSDLLEMILTASDRAASLTAKLLAFARRQPLESAPVEIHQPLREALALFSRTADKRIRIHAGLPSECFRVIGDFSLLQSIFLNLFINASHAMPEGGDLYISSRTVDLDRIYCEMAVFDLQPGPFIEIEVRDTGAGIPESALSRIFEPFFTTKEVGKGTGLGLAAVLGTIQQHGGAVTVYSELKKGTSFHVTLPLTDQEAEKSDELSTELLCGTGTILVVDDEEIMRKTCWMILQDLGYEVLLAKNGLEGLEMFKQAGGRIDLVILDMVMPEMNGRDCFLAIREISRDARIIISSAFSRLEELEDLEEQGLCGVIRKPFRRLELAKIVRTVLLSNI